MTKPVPWRIAVWNTAIVVAAAALGAILWTAGAATWVGWAAMGATVVVLVVAGLVVQRRARVATRRDGP